MKNSLITWVLSVMTALLSTKTGAQSIRLLFYEGGAKLMQNGEYLVTYQIEEVAMYARVLVDEYRAVGSQQYEYVTTYVAARDSRTPQLGVNSILFSPQRAGIQPGFWYVIRVAGTIPRSTFVYQDVGEFFEVTRPGLVYGQMLTPGTNWLRGESKTVTVYWQDLPTNYPVQILLKNDLIPGDYGFLLTTNTFSTSSGQTNIVVPFPNNGQRVNQDPNITLYDLKPGPHILGVWLPRDRVHREFASEFVVSDDLIVSCTPANTLTHVYPGTTIEALNVEFNATFASNDIAVSEVPLSIGLGSNIIMRAELYHPDGELLDFVDLRNTDPAKGIHEVYFPNSWFVVPRGTVVTLQVKCIISPESGPGYFRWYVYENTRVTATTFGTGDGAPVSVGEIRTYSNLVNVRLRELEIHRSPDGKTVLLTGIVSPNKVYSLQESRNFADWFPVKEIRTGNSTNFAYPFMPEGRFRFFRLVDVTQ